MNTRESSEQNKSTPVPVAKGAAQKEAHPILALQHEMNRLFSDFFGATLPSLWRSSERMFNLNPAADVVETDKDIKITAEVPGLDAKDISVTIDGQYVTIKGEKKEEKKEEKNGYFRQERSYGEFQRVIALPEIANADKAEASISKGVLTVSVPKKAGSQSKERKIEIKQAA